MDVLASIEDLEQSSVIQFLASVQAIALDPSTPEDVLRRKLISMCELAEMDEHMHQQGLRVINAYEERIEALEKAVEFLKRTK